MTDVSAILHPSADPSLRPPHFWVSFQAWDWLWYPIDVLVPEAEQRCSWRINLVFKFLPWPMFEPRTLQSDGRERYYYGARRNYYAYAFQNGNHVFLTRCFLYFYILSTNL